MQQFQHGLIGRGCGEVWMIQANSKMTYILSVNQNNNVFQDELIWNAASFFSKTLGFYKNNNNEK